MTLAQPPKDFTHGEILRWRRVGGLVLAEVRYAPGQRVPRHLHPHARFVLVLAGSLTEVRGDETHRYESSSLLFRSAGEPHSYLISKSGATCLVVDVEEAWYARAQQHAPVLTGSAAFRRGFVVHLAHRLHGEFRQIKAANINQRPGSLGPRHALRMRESVADLAQGHQLEGRREVQSRQSRICPPQARV